MADPISILGATASVMSIIDLLSKSIGLLDNLRSQWKTADLALLSLTSQLGALNAALFKIREWMDSILDELHHQLVMDLKSTIDCCKVLASKVHEEINGLQSVSGGAMLSTAKARFIFKRHGMSELQSMIDRQVLALTLLLTACNSKSIAEQQEILSKSFVRKQFTTIQRDTASIISLVDSSSFSSRQTEKSSKLSLLFDFDEELFTSKPYKTLIRKTIKLSILSQKPRNLSEPSQVWTSIFSNVAGFLPEIPNPSSGQYPRKVGIPQCSTNILLLGPGESSKSTFLKQMQSIYCDNYFVNERLEWRRIIYDNLKTAFQTLLSVYDEGNTRSQKTILPIARLLQENIGVVSEDSLPPQFADVFRTLLDGTAHSGSPPKCFDELQENLDYFAKHLRRVCDHEYRPSNEDIIHARVRTTGIHKHAFQIDHNECIVYDVGGERSERKKWKFVFAETSVVTIFVSMSCYDQVLYEDNTKNRMEEARDLFESIANRSVTQTKMILCFTKIDVFESKINSGRSPITDYLKEYTGSPTDVVAAKDFITAMFTDLPRTQREISVHYIDATNTDSVRIVLAAILDNIPKSSPHIV